MVRIKNAVTLITTYIIIILLTACSSSHLKQPFKEATAGTLESNTTEKKFLQDLPNDFEDKALEHIKKLSSFEMRYAGSKAEALTIDYLSNCFKQSGLDTKSEKFKFKCFDSTNIKLTINGEEIVCKQVMVNPYENTNINGMGVLYDPAVTADSNLNDNIVIAANTENFYRLTCLNAKAVAILSKNVFDKLKNTDSMKVNIDIAGKAQELSTYNIIGSIYPSDSTVKKEIIISAHWDSYKGPGASDNASGIGVMLELARYYSSIKTSLPYTIRFAALGGEELNMLGAKAYTSKHASELKNCVLLFNIDEVGGDKDMYIEMNSDRCSPASSGRSSDNRDLFSFQDYSGRWMLNIPVQTYAVVPDWLKEHINKSCLELNYKFNPGNGMGTDHQIFAQYGVPSTNICIAGDTITHSPADTPDKICTASLRKAGEVVIHVVDKVLER